MRIISIINPTHKIYMLYAIVDYADWRASRGASRGALPFPRSKILRYCTRYNSYADNTGLIFIIYVYAMLRGRLKRYL